MTAPFPDSASLLPLVHPPVFTGVAFPAIFLLPQMRGPVTDGAFRLAYFCFPIFPDVRGLGIVAPLAVQINVHLGQGKSGTTVIKFAVAFAAFAGDILILDRLENLSSDGQFGQRVTILAAYFYMK
jgi:hypothetical protein